MRCWSASQTNSFVNLSLLHIHQGQFVEDQSFTADPGSLLKTSLSLSMCGQLVEDQSVTEVFQNLKKITKRKVIYYDEMLQMLSKKKQNSSLRFKNT